MHVQDDAAVVSGTHPAQASAGVPFPHWTSDWSGDEQPLTEALREANIPVLLMVNYHLTGDDRWLSAPYLPTRTKGLDDHDTGGLADRLQEEVRSAARDAITAWRAGAPIARPLPREDELLRMMEVCVGAAVPSNYASMMLEEMEFLAPEVPVLGQAAAGFEVVIVGAGISGIACAKALSDRGIPFTVIERNPELGGTWLNNSYPGCSVDTPSYLYSFSYRPRNWPRYFARQPEVLSYLRDVAAEFSLRDRIRFETEVVGMTWDEPTASWTVEVVDARGERSALTAKAVITAVGQLNRPSVPSIPGAELFAGEAFHSAEWPSGLDIAGKRVAVIGTGASAMQIVPAIADEVASLTVVQRSPQWIAPNPQYSAEVTEARHWLLDNVPYYRRWYRFRLAFAFNDKIYPSLQIDPDWPHPRRSINATNDRHRQFLTDYMVAEMEGHPELQSKCLPTYPPYGKRMLIDQGWFRALRKPNVELLSDEVVALTDNGIVTAGGETREVDVLIYATGFHARKLLYPMDVVGANGTRLSQVWGDDDARAYLGLTTPRFPNLFFMYGPNTNLGHGGSFIGLAESQSRYIAQALTTMILGGLRSIECKQAKFDAYNQEVDAAHDHMIWSHRGMGTWYRNDQGRVVTNMPWRVVDYWHLTRHFELDDFDVVAEEAS